MTSNPQPLKVRRRGGAKRGDHGSYVATEPASPPAADATTPPAAATDASATSSSAVGRPRRVGKPVSDVTAAAKATYDAKPKVIFRGVDDDTYYALRAIYKHQLRTPNGVEGWSEWGRQLLCKFVEQYEAEHGAMTGGEDVKLPAGRRLKQ